MDISERTPLLIPPSSSSTRPGIGNLHERDDTEGSPVPNDGETNTNPVRRLRLFNGIAIVLGLQIGSGIFSSPSLVARHAGSASGALLVWFLAGVVAWACAACYFELGTRMPVNGGPQEYLAHCFNDLLAFLASWACIFAVKPCSAAILALTIADYLCDAFSIDNRIFGLASKLIALLVLGMVTIINCFSTYASNMVTNSLLVCKIFGVGFGALIFLSSPSSTVPSQLESLSGPGLGNYTDATLSAMWAYSGWETLSFVAGELNNPGRNIALVTNISMACVIVLFLLANVAYFATLPFTAMVASTNIGLTFSLHFFQRAGGALYTIVICLSSFGSLNIKVFTAGRLTQAASERHYLPLFLKTIEKRTVETLEREPRSRFLELLWLPTCFGDGSIPFSAIIFNGLLAAIYVLIGEFSSLVIFIGIVEYSVAFTTLVGLLTHRVRHRPAEDLSIPVTFRVSWLLIFVALMATGVMVSVSSARHPVAGAALIAFCALSAGIYTCMISVKKHR